MRALELVLAIVGAWFLLSIAAAGSWALLAALVRRCDR